MEHNKLIAEFMGVTLEGSERNGFRFYYQYRRFT